MQRLSVLTCLLALLPACGPSVGDFTGHYEVTVSQSVTNCNRSADDTPILEEANSLDISAGSDSDLLITLGDCSFKAEMTEKGRFEIGSQSCTLAQDPEGRITVTGNGEVMDDALSLSLTGTFHTTDFGYSVDCDYAALISTP